MQERHSTAYIVGNGKSRLKFNLRTVDDVVFGCNAIYRDFFPAYDLPHFLVAIDDGVIREIEQSYFPSKRVIIPSLDDRWEPFECNRNRPRSNAGINAMREAVKLGYDNLICLGFDFLLKDETMMLSNVYDGTENYGEHTRANKADNPGRINYLKWFATANESVNIAFAFPNPMDMIDVNLNNVRSISLASLQTQ